MKVIKKPIKLKFEFAKEAGVIDTLEGPVPHGEGAAILTGTKGERWPISRLKFESTYDGDNSTGYCSKKPILVTAVQMSEAFEVVVAWSGATLKGKPGDYHLTYGPGDFGVVDKEIFEETYTVVP